MAGALLRVEELHLHYRTSQGTLQAVDGVSFDLDRNQGLALIGESGSGKSSLARAILRLLPRNVDTYHGRVLLEDSDLMGLPEDRFRREVSWTKISLVPQAAMSSLNPVTRVGDQVAEPIVTHTGASKHAAEERVRQVFHQVGIPEDFARRYSFELSGGMRQRVAIAMALVMEPEVVILDEPTSALDMLTQANIMNVLKQIKWDTKTSFLFITHDIATASELADRVGVMYAGQIVELGSAKQFFAEPLHPYSRKLMASVPRLRDDKHPEFIPGQPPSLIHPPSGCRFAPRCPQRFARCDEEPPLLALANGRSAKCWLHE
jgi:oligopeptide/dipeptide ABC transporter ATP-binding protein